MGDNWNDEKFVYNQNKSLKKLKLYMVKSLLINTPKFLF